MFGSESALPHHVITLFVSGFQSQFTEHGHAAALVLIRRPAKTA